MMASNIRNDANQSGKVMTTISYHNLVGNTIVAIFLSDKKVGGEGKFTHTQVHLTLQDGRSFLFGLIDPDGAECFEVSDPPPQARLSEVSEYVAGLRIRDIIKSDSLSNIGILLEFGKVLINDIGEFQNQVEILTNPEFLQRGDFSSLATKVQPHPKP